MFRPFALVFALLVLAGCSSVEASTPKASLATPSLPCTLPYGTHVALLWPHPDSFAVAASTPMVLVASHDLPKTVTLVATDAKGTANAHGTLERTVRPVKAKQAAFPNPVYYRVSGVALRAQRHYAVALDDLAQNGCAPYARMTGSARFST
jgi:hypothetical protein